MTSKKFTLKSTDGEAFEVDEIVALQSQTIKHMIEDGYADSGIPVPNVTGKTLVKVILYYENNVEANNTDELKAWDVDFIKVD